MAILRNTFTQQTIVLRSSHTFGRHPHNVQTLLNCADISQIHASIRFNHNRWEIIDHSRNGSSMDGKRLSNHHWQALCMPGQIQFGKGEESCWQVVNLDAPVNMLFCAQDQSQIALTQLHNLVPDEHQPCFSIAVNAQGQWVLDQGTPRILEDGMMLELAGKHWEFVCAPDVAITAELLGTVQPVDMEDIVFHFTVSRDEEHVALKINVGDQVFDLYERVHHYCLLILARQRQEDAKNGVEPDAQGWLDCEKFAKMLGLDSSHVNIQIFRARHQLVETIPGASSWPHLIERRRGVVRFGSLKFDIVRGTTS